MNTKKLLISFYLVFVGIMNAHEYSIIPQVKQIKKLDGEFKIDTNTQVIFDKNLKNEADLLMKDIELINGLQLSTTNSSPTNNFISFQMINPLINTLESYSLNINKNSIVVSANSARGIFYASQTLLQLLQVNYGVAPACIITDKPRFSWRGMHLDVARHMFPLNDIKKFLRWMAYHKLNIFHLHLTEDQGWRIEIKKYPKLTSIGAWRRSTPPYGSRKSDNNIKYGGFYTQAQLKDLVAYAKKLHITIVPEIDMPGHMAAAIASYPEIGNTDIQYFNPQVMNRWGVYPYTLAPKEKTFKWIDDVLSEVCEIFPSTYIHIGGDEAPKDQWEESDFAKEFMKNNNLKDTHELQSYFITRIEKILHKKNRKMIGWDEIREGGLSPDATVMSWRGEEGGIASAKEGHNVVMTPIKFTYFNFYQAPEQEQLAKGKHFEAFGGFIPIEKIYGYNPVPTELTPKESQHILGTQAQLWSEYIKTWDRLEYMAFPRIAALSEVAWSPAENKDFLNFSKRLQSIKLQYKRAGINLYEK